MIIGTEKAITRQHPPQQFQNKLQRPIISRKIISIKEPQSLQGLRLNYLHFSFEYPHTLPFLLVPFICDSKAEMPAVISKMVCHY